MLGSEYCSGYIDVLGKWNTGFYCPTRWKTIIQKKKNIIIITSSSSINIMFSTIESLLLLWFVKNHESNINLQKPLTICKSLVFSHSFCVKENMQTKSVKPRLRSKVISWKVASSLATLLKVFFWKGQLCSLKHTIALWKVNRAKCTLLTRRNKFSIWRWTSSFSATKVGTFFVADHQATNTAAQGGTKCFSRRWKGRLDTFHWSRTWLLLDKSGLGLWFGGLG